MLTETMQAITIGDSETMTDDFEGLTEEQLLERLEITRRAIRDYAYSERLTIGQANERLQLYKGLYAIQARLDELSGVKTVAKERPKWNRVVNSADIACAKIRGYFTQRNYNRDHKA